MRLMRWLKKSSKLVKFAYLVNNTGCILPLKPNQFSLSVLLKPISYSIPFLGLTFVSL